MRSIRTDITSINNNFDNAVERSITSIFLYSERFARNTLERYGKVNRSWKDRTGNARQGLKGSVKRDNKKITVRFSHGVSYGIHLERIQAGKYAIVKPTIDKYKNEYLLKVKEYWGV
jgi:hypothetical protein